MASVPFEFVRRAEAGEGVASGAARCTLPFMTKYERARAVGTRASQLNDNSLGDQCRPLVDVGDLVDPLDIADEEMRQGKSPLVLRRYLPCHTSEHPCYEDWTVEELLRSTAGPNFMWYGVQTPDGQKPPTTPDGQA